MHDNVEVVDDDPVGLALAGDAPGDQPLLLLELHQDLVVDALHLARVAAGGDHEVVRERAHLAHVEDDDVLGQLVQGGRGDALCLGEDGHGAVVSIVG